MDTELRSTLEGVIDSAAAETPDVPAVGVTDAGNENPVADATTEATDAGGQAEDTTGRPLEKSAAQRARDANGKFTKAGQKQTAETVAKAPVTQSATPANTSPAEGGDSSPQHRDPVAELKVPQSWKVAIREKFNALPPELKGNPAMLSILEEATRVNQEVQRTMSETASARKLQQEFQETVSPYLGMIQAEGSNPLAAVQNLLQTAAALRTAPPAHKAQMVANIVRQFGIPIDALDSALAGQASEASAHQPPAYQDPRVDQLFATLQQNQSQRQQALAERHRQQLAEFADSNEYFDREGETARYPGVRRRMAAWAKEVESRGGVPDLKALYEEACWADPEVRGILMEKDKRQKAAEAAKAAQASTQRAKVAGSSVRNEPAGPASNGLAKDSVRGTLEAVIASHVAR